MRQSETRILFVPNREDSRELYNQERRKAYSASDLPTATSYWKEAYGIVDLQMYFNSNSYRRCDEYWVDVSNNFCVVKHWMGGFSRKLFSYLMLLSPLL